ncbi:response regulator [Paenibacillus sp. LMG 31456]|uniref:Response regulator n=2 Tax=Paenibacillus foliorum TaxID=2654974 RepID=A0A972GX05_9BACL|nr:response regulator [Paenibacillus foliorum]
MGWLTERSTESNMKVTRTEVLRFGSYCLEVKMYKLILVDDSERVRRGLQLSLDWPSHEIEIIGEAEDGEAAMELIIEMKPDLIISDVLMPHMNGLELTENALRIVPHAKIILLSGYDHFDYVQTAIRNGAFDYLLKPTKVEELLNVINKAKQSIKQELGLLKGVEDLKRQLYQSIPVMKERYLRYLLTGRMTLQEIHDNCDYLQLSIGGNHYSCLVLEIDEPATVIERNRLNDKQLLLFAFKNIADELFREQFYAEIIENVDNQLVMILSGKDLQDVKRYVESLQALVKKMKYYITRYYKVPVYIGIGGVYETTDWISKSYKEAMEAMEYRIYSGEEGVIFYSDVGYTRTQEHIIYPYDLEKKLCLALKIGDKEGACSYARQFLQAIVGDYPHNPEQLRNICLQLVYTLLRMLMEWNISDGKVMDFAALDEQLKKWKTIEHLETWLIQYVTGLTNIIEEKMLQRNVSIIQKAVTFMEQHYHRDISLQEVADAVYLTPNYFANLFKERTGETMLNFLSDIRISKAKELLKQPDIKIYEVAERVGYTDAKYFGQVFKKIVGLTPVEYKKAVSS